MVMKKIKKGLSRFFAGQEEPEYIELDISEEAEKKKILVKPFVLRSFDDIENILNSLREGYTIAVIDIKPLREKDLIELKRAVSKIKKTADALEGDIAGFGENIIIVTPSFAEISKPKGREKKEPEKKEEFGL